MIVHGKVSVLVKFDRLTPNHVDTRPRKGLKWYRYQTANGTISVSFLGKGSSVFFYYEDLFDAIFTLTIFSI